MEIKDYPDEWFWLALKMIPSLGTSNALKVLEKYHHPRELWKIDSKELLSSGLLSSKILDELSNISWKEVENEYRRLQSQGASLIPLGHSNYPENLANVFDPPLSLYVKGTLSHEDRKAIAIVGSRRATRYGINIARRLAGELAKAGVTVVSGIARGIDRAAHEGALDAGGRTLAILGTGLDLTYPRENKEIYERIPGQGAVITEFPFGSQPLPHHFPIRNRIISGLSLGVVVVEAAVRSGSLITARLALEEGREVFAVPGHTTSTTSQGTNALIKQGAKLVDRASDILEEFSHIFPNPVTKVHTNEEVSNSEGTSLAGQEKKVLSSLDYEPMHIDDIARSLSLSPGECATVLLQLQFKGHIHELPGKRFVKTAT